MLDLPGTQLHEAIYLIFPLFGTLTITLLAWLFGRDTNRALLSAAENAGQSPSSWILLRLWFPKLCLQPPRLRDWPMC